jgi:hypothetical protein
MPRGLLVPFSPETFNSERYVRQVTNDEKIWSFPVGFCIPHNAKHLKQTLNTVFHDRVIRCSVRLLSF